MKKRNQKGFTLIEIITVLVILGILVAVAIPKYFGMQEDARNSAGAGALGAAATTVYMSYTKLLVASTAGTDNTALLTALGTQGVVGDYLVNYTASGTTDIAITLQAPTTSYPGKWGTPSTKTVHIIQ